MLKREVEAVGHSELDVLVVGGGIHGAWAALEAALRGLRVALVERDDFGGGASAASLKVLHGGFRYVPRLRPVRVRAFTREQAIAARFAPELVDPLPCLLPTRRRPDRSRVTLWIALALHRALRAGLEPMPTPPDRLIGREETVRLCPALGADDHTGGALWHEGQLLDSERFVLALVASAVAAGAVAANYAEATEFVTRSGRVEEVRIRDHLEHRTVAARPRVVYNATNLPPSRLGTWSGAPARSGHGPGLRRVLGFNVVVERDLSEVAVGLETRIEGEPATPGRSGERLFLLVPWRGRTLLGTGYRLGDPDGGTRVGAADVEALLGAFVSAAPGLDLSPDDVAHLHQGDLPAEAAGDGLRLLDRPALRRGGAAGQENVVSVWTPRYTTARLSAVRGIGACERLLGREEGEDRTASIGPCALPHALPASGPGEEVTAGVVHRAVTTEMAVRLGDLLLRRTNVGASGVPAPGVVERAADLMAEELGWSRSRREEELRALADEYHPLVRGHLSGSAPRPLDRGDEGGPAGRDGEP